MVGLVRCGQKPTPNVTGEINGEKVPCYETSGGAIECRPEKPVPFTVTRSTEAGEVFRAREEERQKYIRRVDELFLQHMNLRNKLVIENETLKRRVAELERKVGCEATEPKVAPAEGRE